MNDELQKKVELREKMLTVLPYLRYAIEEAKETAGSGSVEFGILVKNADGSGRVIASFRAGEFIEDLAEVLGAGPFTEEQRMEAKAAEFVQKFGLKR